MHADVWLPGDRSDDGCRDVPKLHVSGTGRALEKPEGLFVAAAVLAHHHTQGHVDDCSVVKGGVQVLNRFAKLGDAQCAMPAGGP